MDVQAQGDALNLRALKDVTVTSNRGSVTLSASKELTLVCNGAYIKISGGNIELGCRVIFCLNLRMCKNESGKLKSISSGVA